MRARPTLRFNPAAIAAVGLCVLPAFVGTAVAAEDGLPLGDLVVKPSIGIHLIYDSNVDRVQTLPQGDLGVRVIPALGLVYPGKKLRWELNASYLFFTYFNIGDNDHSDLRSVTNFSLGTSFDINRMGKVGFYVAPVFANRPVGRGVDTATGDGDGADALAGEANGPDEELSVATPIELRLRPSSAFNVDVKFGYRWRRTYNTGETALNPTPIIPGNQHLINGGMGLAWRFFPRSSLILDLDIARSIWVEGGSFSDGQRSSWSWNFFGGLKGDITRGGVLSFLAQIGYGNRYFDDGDADLNITAVEGLMGRVEFAIRPVLTQRVAFGFDRFFADEYYSSRITNTQAYIKYKGLFFDRLAVNADFSWLFRTLGIGTVKTEHQWTVGAGVDVLITQWLHAVVEYRFSMVNPAVPDSGEYIDNRVTIGAVFGFK